MAELYQLPDGWEWKKLGDNSVCKLIMGQSPSSDTYNSNGNGIAFFQGKKEFGEIYPTVEQYTTEPKKIAEIGDILLSVRAPVGPTNIANIKCCIGRGLGAIRPNKLNTLTNYLLYFFRNFELEISNKGKGSTFSAITKKELEETDIPLPSLEEQKRIVSKLDTLFEKIDKSISLHQKNIDEANIFMASVLNDVFVELEEKYEKKELSNLVSKLGDGLHGTPKYDDNGDYFFINGANVKDNQIIINQNTKKVNEEEYYKCKKELNDRTIFVSINGTIGNVGLYNNEKCILGKSACYFNLLKDIDKIYITYVLKNGDFQEYIEESSTGATIKNVSLKTMRAYKLPLPPLQTQQKVVTYLDEISQKLEKIKQLQKEKMAHLKALKASILDRAFRGEL
jgi:type I restriction enzyme S subunit